MEVKRSSSTQFYAKLLLASVVLLGSCKSMDCGCPMAMEDKKAAIKKEQKELVRSYEIKTVSLKSE